MVDVLQNIVPQAGILDNEENPAIHSDRLQAAVVNANLTDLGRGGGQTHVVANQAGAERVIFLALTASQRTSDEEEGGYQASAEQVRSSLCKLWRQISGNDKLEQQSLDALEQRMISVEDVVSKARNMHKVKNDHVAAISHLRRIFKSRRKTKRLKRSSEAN